MRGERAIWTWAVVALAACSGTGAEQDDANLGGEQPAREGPTRPPAAQAEGVWTLGSVAGAPMPAMLDGGGACRIEVVDGSIRLEAGRFAFQNRTREVCGETASEPVLHAAGGSYSIDDTNVTLRTDVGEAFRTAAGTITDETLVFEQLSAESGAQPVSWRFHRESSQLVPLPGTSQTTGG